jgi:S-formylglutathione hydrolase FrmB
VGLTSSALLWVLVLLTAALPLAVLRGWSAARGPRFARAGQRLVAVLLAQASAVALTFVAVNDHYVFYADWNDLLGRSSAPPTILPAAVHGAVRASDGGRFVELDAYGVRSGITAPVLVHLPPQYDDPAWSNRTFPVVEFLSGWNGYPRAWISQLGLMRDWTSLEADGRLEPMISVFPTVNVALPRDTECTDVPQSTQAFTWLDADVRSLIIDRFRARTTGSSWGAAGYSTGGYCAAKLALLDPGHFHAAAVLSGYFNALKDGTTGDLWGHSLTYRERNDLLYRTRHGLHPAVDILVVTSRQDPSSYETTAAFLRAVAPPTLAFKIVAPRGGHNLTLIKQSLPDTLAWLSAHLSGIPATRHRVT